MRDKIGGHTIRVPLTYACNDAHDILLRAAVALTTLPNAGDPTWRDELAQTTVNHVFNAVMSHLRQEREDRRLINRLIRWWKNR